MARKSGSKSIRNICAGCGETFYSAQKANYCVNKSTCRVKAHQKKKQAEKVAKAFMMDMDSYQSYVTLIERYPHIKERVDALIFSTTVNISSLAISIMWQVALAESQKAIP